MKNITQLILINYLGSHYVLRLEKWRNSNSWRVGLNWWSENDYEFVCEGKTLKEALHMAYRYVTEDITKPLPSL